MGRFFWQGQTYLRLGLTSLFFVALYRMALRNSLFKRKMPMGQGYSSNLFPTTFSLHNTSKNKAFASSKVVEDANDLLKGKIPLFSDKKHLLGSPPDWFFNPIEQLHYPNPQKHWSTLGDFDTGAGDIKCIWEISRFDWILTFSRAFSLTNDERYLNALNDWVCDWTLQNPANTGPNWKCGQEVSIRIMQVLLAAYLLGQHDKSHPDLIRFITEHADRIELTILYAVAQNNNHGTSEAAALFMAGSWLQKLAAGDYISQGQRWMQLGRKWLENRVAQLVADDGSFSQYSVNYHRVMLDTLSLAEFWRDLMGEPHFSYDFIKKAKTATRWLYFFTNEQTGEAPNIGANDGARLFNLSSGDFRDYRPTVQLASKLFYGKPAYQHGEYDEPLIWLGLQTGEPNSSASPLLEKKPTIFEQGGYCYLSLDDLEVYIRFPSFRFRPGHADALHLDLWYKGDNIIRDGGSYSYNAENQWLAYFSGTRSHSTVEFDGRDQMPRLSRFLFGKWLKTRGFSGMHAENDKITWSAGYKDYKGAEHHRKVSLSRKQVSVTDTLRGFRNKAIIRWRLKQGDWQLEDMKCFNKKCCLSISADVPIKSFQIVEGYESRYYQSKTTLPVLEVQVTNNAVVSTEIIFSKSC
ncbi:MAG: hypothetical protein AMK70_11365 [Nitrospira bacterium SG8_35_1]|nr:MAG: hypothetical protein AMK70_11365 [Nitrospira bacterium SG8_35_1]